MPNLLDHQLISERYFFPRADAPPNPFVVDCGDAQLACSYHELSPDALTVLHFHGNGEVVADYVDFLPKLFAQMGCNLFLAEFRGYGGSTGQPQLGKMLSDVATTIDAIGQPTTQLVLFGRSVGSLFAAKAVELFPDIAGLVMESAVADPLQRLLLRVRPQELGASAEEFRAEVAAQMGIEAAMRRFNNPALILHTRNDGLIDLSHGQRLAQWCGGDARLEIFEQGNHNDIMFVNGQRYFVLVKELLDQLRD